MNKISYLKKFGLVSLLLAFSCQTLNTTPSTADLTTNALTSKAGFIKFFETCVLSKSTVTEEQKQLIRTQLNLLNLVPDATWEKVSTSYKELYDKYSKYCDEKIVVTSPTPSSDTSASPSPSSSPMSSPSSSSIISTGNINFDTLDRDGFINLYQCILDNSDLNITLKQQALAAKAIIKALPENYWNLAKANYSVFIKENLKYCKGDLNSISTPVASSAPLVAPTSFGELSCDMEGKLKSGTGKGINVNFNNKMANNVKVYWLDFNGKRVSYNANLKSNATHPQGTFLTHPWLIADSNDKCLKIYVPDGNSAIDIN